MTIYTAEALATLDGNPLKQFVMVGRTLKEQAQAYLAKATDSAAVTRLAAENESLKAALLQMQAAQQQAPSQELATTPFDDMDEESLKEWIKDSSGSRPRGNPSLETLRRMATEINDDLKSKKAEAA